MKRLIMGVIAALISGVIGTVTGGTIHDALWAGGDFAVVNINQCDELPQGWKIQCEEVKTKYDNGKSLFHFIGFIIPFAGVLIFFSRLE